MKRARFSEEQIITILKEAEGGAKVAELCRRHGISDATFNTWRSKYGGLEVSEMRQPRQLEEAVVHVLMLPLPEAVTAAVIDLALKEPEWSPRELATAFVDQQQYFVSEASVYGLLKPRGLIPVR